ncbi:M18 family aminopeptidase [Micrococcus luteus]|uniref:M18 family aminopeptidase n=1 Tax=Micrococcus luteus TaxID=1270 RepID=UPI002B254750|nr:M18 family aminopeptidase [Micrococcus luteus]MEB2537981.1 M18 family aminopeptidase [Micrococcus luteus]
MTHVTRDTAAEMPAHLRDLAEFVTASPSSYHAAEEVARRLEAVGFTRLDETADFPAAPGGYVVVRDGAAVAWIVPTGAEALGRHEGAEARAAGPDEAGSSAGVVPVFRVLGAHTDSPGFKIKPNPATVTADGWVQAGVEVYGGPLLNSWLDRELRFAGRLALDDGTQVLAATGPVGRIPQLAIHLDREVNEGLTLKRQRHTNPVVGALAPRGEGADEVEVDGLAARVPGDVLTALAAAAGVDPAAVRGHDVVVADAQAPGLFGLAGEFFASGRLDNLSSVHAGLVALEELAREHGGAEGAIAYEGTVAGGVAGEASGAPVIPLLAAFDHEELGSASRSGAAGPLLEEVMGRVLEALGVAGQARARAIAGSWLLSADAGHLVHPNYAERHDPVNHPRVNHGPLLKINANQRYATDAGGEAAFARWCGVAGVPFQEFVSNNDVPCGSTIGPISATRLGIRTVDVGLGLLSMHSAREMCGVRDVEHLTAAVREFFRGV